MRVASKTRKVLASAIGLAITALLSTASAFGADWTVETVDQSGPGSYASMKIDKNGNVHIAYVPEEDQHPLKYAFWDHSLKRWFTMTVANAASFCSLALDSKQRPHISYADHGTGAGAKLRYASWDGVNWKIQAVSPRGAAVVAYYTSIALDANDTPVFSYYDYGDPSGAFRLWLRGVFWTGSYWGVTLVDRTQGSGKFNSIAIDSKGQTHIAYANVRYESSSLRYATWNGSSWQTEFVEGATGPTPVYSVSMVLDKADNPHIGYTNVETKLVKYATRRNGVWLNQVIDAIRKDAYPDRNGIVVDDRGNPYLSYYDEGEGRLKLAYVVNGRWRVEVLAENSAGFTSSLQIHDDTLWVAYADQGDNALKVARRPLADLLAPAAGKEVSSVKGSIK